MSTPTSLALYVHIPFCETKCPYCDFNTYAGIESLMPGYVDALAHEIAQWGAWLERPLLGSVFFGGGTPSYLPGADLAGLMDAVCAAFELPGEVETTIEANPGDCTAEQLAAMRLAGFNRISIGVQSFDDSELRLLGRRHSAAQARQAVEAARGAGFDNTSVDLMLGLPDQQLPAWERTLDEAVALDTDHVSVYALTLEPGTPMEADVRGGRTSEPDPDLAADMYLLTQRSLASAGFEQYEISNWAKPGRSSRHNLIYWRSQPYLGVGPGAHSYLFGAALLDALGPDGTRFANLKSPRAYIDRVTAWKPARAVTPGALQKAGAVETAEELSATTAMAETMMMGLRLNAGVSDREFRRRFGVGIAEQFPEAVAECIELGLLVWHRDWLRLTEGGRLLGNEAFGRFVAAPLANPRSM